MPRPKPTIPSVVRPDESELLIALLRYIVQDVRLLSARGARHIELAITVLAEDTDLVDMSDEGTPNRLS